MLCKTLDSFYVMMKLKNLVNEVVQLKSPRMNFRSRMATHNSEENITDVAEEFLKLEKMLVARLSLLTKESFRTKAGDKAVEYIYNPLIYAFDLHNEYIRKYCRNFKKLVFLGMNPGPFGMVQTGVPFGEIDAVRDYLKIEGKVSKPEKFHPHRPVEGLNCKRSEVSGKRLWNLIKELSKNDPNVFFKHCFVHNYCPLAFLSKSGLNVTPADLKPDDQKTLNSICDEFLAETLTLLKSETVIAVGRFAEKRTLEVVKNYKLNNINVVCIPHPSPRNANTKNWAEDTMKVLKKFDLIDYLQ